MKRYWIYLKRGRHTVVVLVLLSAPGDHDAPRDASSVGRMEGHNRVEVIRRLYENIRSLVFEPEQAVLPW